MPARLVSSLLKLETSVHLTCSSLPPIITEPAPVPLQIDHQSHRFLMAMEESLFLLPVHCSGEGRGRLCSWPGQRRGSG